MTTLGNAKLSSLKDKIEKIEANTKEKVLKKSVKVEQKNQTEIKAKTK